MGCTKLETGVSGGLPQVTWRRPRYRQLILVVPNIQCTGFRALSTKLKSLTADLSLSVSSNGEQNNNTQVWVRNGIGMGHAQKWHPI